MKINNLEDFNKENSNLNLKQKAKKISRNFQYSFSEDITNQNAIQASILNAANNRKHKIKILVYKLLVEDEGAYGFTGFDNVINLSAYNVLIEEVVSQMLEWLKKEGFADEDIYISKFQEEEYKRWILTVSW